MNVASKELCQELYELSGWSDLEQYWEHYPVSGETRLGQSSFGNVLPKMIPEHIVPAYDLGYLLWKLPEWIEPEKNSPHLLTVQPNPIGRGWNALYRLSVATPTSDRRHAEEIHEADTPENAACKLAIELFKQGILKREDTHE